MAEGWIKLHRKMLENPIVCKDGDYLAVWVYLLLNATHKNYPALFKGKKIELKPGQLLTGRKSIAASLGINESKVKRVLSDFESDQQIDRQRSNVNSLISILNWEKYQTFDQPNDQQMTSQWTASDQPVTSRWTASDQPVTTNKNVNNVNNERMEECKNERSVRNKKFTPPSFEEVKDYCFERGNNLDPQRFIDFYTSKGWVIGKSKMKDWKAAVRNWEKNSNPKNIKEGRLDWIDDIR